MPSSICRSIPLSLLFLLLFSIAIRFFSFFPSVIDHDESTYIVVSDAILNGKTYFVDVIDTKPVGVFLLYAGLQKLFGSGIFILRLLAAVFLGLTAFFLYLAKRKAGSTALAAMAAGIIYLILNAIFTYYGVSPNTETFFNLFTALALWLWIEEKNAGLFFLAGLSLGLGFITKYVVAFDALAFGLFMLWMAYGKKVNWGATMIRAFLMLLGFVLPFGLTLLYYRQSGHLDDFLFYSFQVSSRYPDAARPFDYIKFFFDFNLRFFPVVIMAVYVLWKKRENAWLNQFALLWLCCVWIVVLLPGKFFAHYCIQVMLPLSFIAGSFFEMEREKMPNWLRVPTSKKVGLPLLIVLLLLNTFFHKMDYYDKRDIPREMASFLKENMEEGDIFYVGNYEQILYHLLDQPSPIPYVHSSLVWRQNHIDALMVDVDQIVDRLKAKAPRYIFRKKSEKDNDLPVQDWLEQEYELVKSVKDEIFVYEKKHPLQSQ